MPIRHNKNTPFWDIFTKEEDMRKTKVLRVKPFGWKRIARNVQRFGWTAYDAEEETTTTTETSYTGEIVGNKVYITPHTKSSTKVRVWLSFYRNSDNFKNLYAIKPFELLYGIVFWIRRILGTLLPIATVIMFIFVMINQSTPNPTEMESMFLYYLLALGIWVLGMVLEGIIARIANKILKCK